MAKTRSGRCTTEHTRICTTPLYVAIPTCILSENYSVQVLILHHPSSTASESALSSTTRDRKTPNGLSRKLYSPIQNASLHHNTPSTAIPHIPFSSSKFQASPHLEKRESFQACFLTAPVNDGMMTPSQMVLILSRFLSPQYHW